jgi:hypothetical protein
LVKGALNLSQAGAIGTLNKRVTESGPVLIPKDIYRVVAVGGGGSARSSAGTTDEDQPERVAGLGGSGSSGEMVETYVKLDTIHDALLLAGLEGRQETAR